MTVCGRAGRDTADDDRFRTTCAAEPGAPDQRCSSDPGVVTG